MASECQPKIFEISPHLEIDSYRPPPLTGEREGEQIVRRKFSDSTLQESKVQNPKFYYLSFGIDLKLIHHRFITSCELCHLAF